MGLLDIWNDWRKESNYGRTDLTTAGGGGGGGNEQTLQRKYKRGQFPPTDPKYIRDKKEITTPRRRVIKQEGTPINAPGHVGHPMMNKTFPVVPTDARKKSNLMKNDFNKQGGINESNTDPRWWHKLANMANVDFDKAMASWKDKGGFEGLMANPAFTMGLAFMQAGAEGKTLGQGALDNVMKAGGISQHYKKIIEDRKQEPIQATAGDIDEVKSLLKTMNVDDPGWHEKLWGKLKGKNVQMKFDIAAEDIALELQKEMARLQEANKGKKPLVFGYREKERILKRLLREGKFKKKGGTWFTAGTLESDVGGSFPEPMAKGGPIQAGKPYLVGEEGPEVVIPHSDCNVLSNDDSQIYAMLLASNPQLQKVSRARAEKILRSRFPEYFE